MEWILLVCVSVCCGLYFKKRFSGEAKALRRTKNPYHAVSIKKGLFPCKAVIFYSGRRFFSHDAPVLPLSSCSDCANCECRYRHHNDRRNSDNERRIENIISSPSRSLKSNVSKSLNDRRKQGRGRRWDDRETGYAG